MIKVLLTISIDCEGKTYTMPVPGGVPVRDKQPRTISLYGYSDAELLNNILNNVAAVYTSARYPKPNSKWNKLFLAAKDSIKAFVARFRFKR